MRRLAVSIYRWHLHGRIAHFRSLLEGTLQCVRARVRMQPLWHLVNVSDARGKTLLLFADFLVSGATRYNV